MFAFDFTVGAFDCIVVSRGIFQFVNSLILAFVLILKTELNNFFQHVMIFFLYFKKDKNAIHTKKRFLSIVSVLMSTVFILIISP